MLLVTCTYRVNAKRKKTNHFYSTKTFLLSKNHAGARPPSTSACETAPKWRCELVTQDNWLTSQSKEYKVTFFRQIALFQIG